MHKGIGPNNSYFSDSFYAEHDGVVDSIYIYHNQNFISTSYFNNNEKENIAYQYKSKNQISVNLGDNVKVGDVLYTGNVVNNLFYIDMSRLLLLLVFSGVILMIHLAYKKNKKQRRY
jgi:hypothetical protein